MADTPLVLAFCSYRRATRLPALVAALRAQSCPVPFRILAVNNASPDDTAQVLEKLQREPGPPLEVVCEQSPGIVPARNRALANAADCTVLAFLDDDELPQPGWAAAAWDAITREGADCAGGRIDLDFTRQARPRWLGDDLLGFLAAIDHGPEAFWITSEATPLWTSNIAYRMALLQTAGLKFDARYNRQGASASGAGGGEDVVMLRSLLARKARIRYRPDMGVIHDVEASRLQRRWFLRLHYHAGVRKGLHEIACTPPLLAGAPRYLYTQCLRQLQRTLSLAVHNDPATLRQAMNLTHAFGLIRGCRARQLS